MTDGWYYCSNCKRIFYSDDIVCHVIEDVDYSLCDRPVMRFYEYFCPVCGSEELEECPTCDYCGDCFLPEELDENGLCEECRKEVNEDGDPKV